LLCHIKQKTPSTQTPEDNEKKVSCGSQKKPPVVGNYGLKLGRSVIMDDVALLVVETDERLDIRLLAPPPVDALLSRPAPSSTQVHLVN
jgi:hypothetical protein